MLFEVVKCYLINSPFKEFLMKKRILLFLFFCLQLNSFSLFAQGWLWATGSTCPRADCEGFGGVAVGSNGNVYGGAMLIQSTVPVSPLEIIFGNDTIVDYTGVGHQSILVCTDSNGHYLWQITTRNAKVYFTGIKTDAYDNVYVLGNSIGASFTFGSVSYSSSSSTSSFCAKVTSTGIVLWVREIPVPLYPVCFQISKTGSIYMGGVYNAACTVGSSLLPATGAYEDDYVAKYDSSLTPLWATGFGGDSLMQFSSIAVSDDSEVFAAGTYKSDTLHISSFVSGYTSSGRNRNFFLAKFSATGTPKWVKMTKVDTFFDYVKGCTVDQAGNAYITGNYYGNISFGSHALPNAIGHFQMFLSKYDSSGNVKWARTIADNSIMDGNMVEADNCGNIWLIGQGGHAPYFPSDPMYIAHFDTAGSFIDTFFIASGGDDASYLTLDKKGNLYVCGDYTFRSLQVGYDSLLLNDSTGETFFMAKYIYDLLGCVPDTVPPPNHHLAYLGNTTTPEAFFSLYPNPATEKCTIYSSLCFGQGDRADLFDITGRLAGSYGLAGYETNIPLVTMQPGIYLCKVHVQGITICQKMLVMH